MKRKTLISNKTDLLLSDKNDKLISLFYSSLPHCAMFTKLYTVRYIVEYFTAQHRRWFLWSIRVRKEEKGRKNLPPGMKQGGRKVLKARKEEGETFPKEENRMKNFFSRKLNLWLNVHPHYDIIYSCKKISALNKISTMVEFKSTVWEINIRIFTESVPSLGRFSL